MIYIMLLLAGNEIRKHDIICRICDCSTISIQFGLDQINILQLKNTRQNFPVNASSIF